MKRSRGFNIFTGALLLIVALNAFAGGFYGLAGADNVPVEWLENSPFTSYFVPSLFLFVVVGGVCLIAGILILKNHGYGKRAAIVCGSLQLLWIAVQVAVIGYVSWMQPAIAICGIVVLAMSPFLTLTEPKGT